MQAIHSIARTLTLTATLVVGSTTAAAQNLVPNPSYESYTTCPITIGQTDRCVAWSSPTNGTPDYLNACHTGPIVGVPTNTWGSEAARTGKAYTSCIVFMDKPAYVGEYIEAKLTTPLAAGQSYEVSFWVSLADKSNWAIAELGAYLSVGSVGPTSSYPLPYTPQIQNPSTNIITAKSGWTQIKGTYTAAGGEDHIVIGCFKAGTAVTSQNVGGLLDWANYYIDDASVTRLGGGGVVTKPHVIGWSDTPVLPATPGFLDVQRVDNNCQPARTRCRTVSLQRAVTSYAGGTAYDPRRQSVWASDGRTIAEFHLGNGSSKSCTPRCQPFAPKPSNPRALVSGLAHSERRGALFHLATAPGHAEITTHDNRGKCPGKNTTCTMSLPANALAGGLAYDEVSDLLFISVSIPGLARGFTTELWVAHAAAPCRVLCRRKLFSCSTGLVTGLAYESRGKRLYATDGQITQSFTVIDARQCNLTVGVCCKKQHKPIYRGLCVISGWVKQVYGRPCMSAPCPRCPNVAIGSQGDPSIGGEFQVSLSGAPAGATAWLFGKVGGCGSGIQLPLPLCGTMYGLPSQILFPGLRTTGLKTCDGRANWVLPIPAASQLQGIKLCLQWYFACRGATGSGAGLSQAFDFSITGG